MREGIDDNHSNDNDNNEDEDEFEHDDKKDEKRVMTMKAN